MVVESQQRRNVRTRRQKTKLTAFWLSNSATCVAFANPLRIHRLDKLAKASFAAGSMYRDD